jgi:hypothetical protein
MTTCYPACMYPGAAGSAVRPTGLSEAFPAMPSHPIVRPHPPACHRFLASAAQFPFLRHSLGPLLVRFELPAPYPKSSPANEQHPLKNQPHAQV